MDTFTRNIEAPVQASSPMAQVGVAAASPLSSGAGPLQISATLGQPDNSVSDALLKLGKAIIAPKVAEEQQRRLTEGMMLALQGQSAASIKSEEMIGDWFGDSTVVQGARSIEVATKLQAQQNDIQTQMPELAKMSPAEFRQWLPSQLRSHTTGDPATDGPLLQAAMQRLPQIVDGHTKAHIEYQNNVAAAAYEEAFATQAKSYQLDALAVREGKMPKHLAEQSQAELLASAMGPDGMNPAKYPKYLYGSLSRMLQEGNLEAYNALSDSGIAGGALSDAQLASLDRQRTRAEVKRNAATGANKAFGSSQALFEQVLDAGGGVDIQSLDAVDSWIDKYNQDYAMSTGSSTPKINDAQRLDYKRKYLAGIERASATAGKLDNGEDELAFAVQALQNGTTHALKGRIKEQPLRDGMTLLWEQNIDSNPDQVMNMMAQTEEKWPPMEQAVTRLRNNLSTGKITAADLPAAALVAKLANHASADILGRYVGDDLAPIMDLFRGMHSLKTDKEKIDYFNENAQQYGAVSVPISESAKEAGREEVLKLTGDSLLRNLSPWGNTAYKGLGLDKDGREMLAAKAMPRLEKLIGRGMSPGAAAAHVLGGMMHSTDFVLGQPVSAAGGIQTFLNRVNAVELASNPKAVLTEQQSPVYQQAVQAVTRKTFLASGGKLTTFGGLPEVSRIVQTSAGLFIDIGEPGEVVSILVTPEAVAATIPTVNARPLSRRTQLYLDAQK